MRLQTVGMALSIAALSLASTGASAQLEWHEEWNVPTLQHGLLAGGLALGGLSIVLFADTDEAAWSAPNAFDEPVLNGLGARTPRGRRIVSIASDITRNVVMLSPLVLDSSLAARQDVTIGARLSLISALSLAASAFATATFKYTLRRERPYARECDPFGEDECGSRRNRSFVSGHTVLAFASASLTCTYNQHLELYPSRAASIAACGTSMLFATLTGALRLVSRRHFLSDVLVGAVIGVLAGWLLPTALYFGFDR